MSSSPPRDRGSPPGPSASASASGSSSSPLHSGSQPATQRKVVTSSGRVISINKKPTASQSSPSPASPRFTITTLTSPHVLQPHSQSPRASHPRYANAQSSPAVGGVASSPTGGPHSRSPSASGSSPRGRPISGDYPSSSFSIPSPAAGSRPSYDSSLAPSSLTSSLRSISAPPIGFSVNSLLSSLGGSSVPPIHVSSSLTGAPTPISTPNPAAALALSATVPVSSSPAATPSTPSSLPGALSSLGLTLPLTTPSLLSSVSLPSIPSTLLPSLSLDSALSQVTTPVPGRRRRTAGFGQGLAQLEKKKTVNEEETKNEENETKKECDNQTENEAAQAHAAPEKEKESEAAAPADESSQSAPQPAPAAASEAPIETQKDAQPDSSQVSPSPAADAPAAEKPQLESSEALARSESSNSAAAAAVATPTPVVDLFPAEYKSMTKSEILGSIQRLDHELHEYEREMDKLEFDLEMLNYHGGNEGRLDKDENEEEEEDDEDDGTVDDDEMDDDGVGRLKGRKRLQKRGRKSKKGSKMPDFTAESLKLTEEEAAILKDIELQYSNMNAFDVSSFSWELSAELQQLVDKWRDTVQAMEKQRARAKPIKPSKVGQSPQIQRYSVESSLIEPVEGSVERILYENRLRSARSHHFFHRLQSDSKAKTQDTQPTESTEEQPPAAESTSNSAEPAVAQPFRLEDVVLAPGYLDRIQSFPRFRLFYLTVIQRRQRHLHSQNLRFGHEFRRHEVNYGREHEKSLRQQWNHLQNNLSKRGSRQRLTGGSSNYSSQAQLEREKETELSQFPFQWYLTPNSAEYANKERELSMKRVKYARCAAPIPEMLPPSERIRRTQEFHSRNQRVEDPVEEWNSFYSQNPWTEREKRLFLSKYLKFPKQFRKIASFFPQKSVNECIQYYYESKLEQKYKELLKQQAKMMKSGKGKRGAAAGAGVLEDDDDLDFPMPAPVPSTPAVPAPSQRARGSSSLAMPSTPSWPSATPSAARQDKVSRELIGLALDLSVMKDKEKERERERENSESVGGKRKLTVGEESNSANAGAREDSENGGNKKIKVDIGASTSSSTAINGSGSATPSPTD